jgi:hypothetical protein
VRAFRLRGPLHPGNQQLANLNLNLNGQMTMSQLMIILLIILFFVLLSSFFIGVCVVLPRAIINTIIKSRPDPTGVEAFVVYIKAHGWWGTKIDYEREIDALLKSFQSRGYLVVAFSNHNGLFPNIPFSQILLISLACFLSFGFYGIYFGPSFVIRKAI